MSRLIWVASLVALLVGARAVPARADLDECLDLVATEGPGERAAECFFIRAREQAGLADAAREVLEELSKDHPEAPWPRYYLGRIPPWAEHARPHLEVAADLFERRSETSAAIRARFYLAAWHFMWLSINGEATHREEGAEQLELLDDLLGENPSDPDLALVEMARAYDLMVRAEDFQGAYLLMLDAHQRLTATPDVHPHEMKECVRALLDLSLTLARTSEAAHWAEQSARLASEEGRLRDQAGSAHNLIEMRLQTTAPSESRRSQLVEELRKTLDLARRSGYTWVEASASHLLAEIEGGPRAPDLLQTCVALAAGDIELQGRCLKTAATQALEHDPAAARALLDRANALGGDGPWAYLASWDDQLRVLWATEGEELALTESEAILALIESLRRNQIGEAADRVLSYSASAYYWLSGRLLRRVASGNDPDGRAMAHAFSIIERLRAQTLREALSAPEDERRPSAAVGQALAEIDREFTEIAQRLFDLSVDADDRQALLVRLQQLDREAAEVRRLADADNPALPTLEPPSLGLLSRISDALAADAAMLSFQIGLWEGWDREFAGGSWLIVTTSEGSRLYPLDADRAVIEPAVRALRARSDPDDEPALVALHRRLLEPALSELPERVTKLVLIPDGMLHLLPFALLREHEGAAPLVERFELQVVPSASVWLHWREGTPMPSDSGAGALVLANPLVPMETVASRSRGGSLTSVATLGPLPFAEREGKRVLRNLNGHGRLERRGEANESLVKGTDLTPYRVLHFAAHAYLDLEHPALSGIVLAASEGEDGLLRPSEIAHLDGLEDKLIVLAACNTAAGEVLRGEGVLSVARAFFQAGAEAVIASLWKIDDRQATDFFDDFYGRLREGVSVSEALAATQSEWSTAGRPAATWAAMVVLGNGDFVPLPGGVPDSFDRRWWIAAGLVALLILSAVLLRRSRDPLG